MAAQVEICLQDYRTLDEQFDALLSCEMIEAVGKEYLPSYFKTIQASLKPGAKAVIQAMYSSFKAQVLLAHIFRKNLGAIKRRKLAPLVQKMLGKDFNMQEKMEIIDIESQLTFLRASATMAMTISALVYCNNQNREDSFTTKDVM